MKKINKEEGFWFSEDFELPHEIELSSGEKWRIKYVLTKQLDSSLGSNQLVLADLSWIDEEGYYCQKFQIMLELDYSNAYSIHYYSIITHYVREYEHNKYGFEYLEGDEEKIKEIENFFDREINYKGEIK